MGAESGSQRILDAMDKGLSRRTNLPGSRQLVATRHPRLPFFLQFGYPGEGHQENRGHHPKWSARQSPTISASRSLTRSRNEILRPRLSSARSESKLVRKRRPLHDVSAAPFRPSFYRSLGRCATPRGSRARQTGSALRSALERGLCPSARNFREDGWGIRHETSAHARVFSGRRRKGTGRLSSRMRRSEFCICRPHLRNLGFDVDIYDSTFGSKQELISLLCGRTSRRHRHLRQLDDEKRMRFELARIAGEKRLEGSPRWTRAV